MSEMTVTMEVTHQGRKGSVQMVFNEWVGDQIPISFQDGLYKNEGTIYFNGKSGRTLVTSQKPYRFASDSAMFDGYFGSLVSRFARCYTFGWSPASDQMVTYDADYHASNSYTQGTNEERQIKSVQAQIIRELVNPAKCVIAGCSNGELVRQCRAIGLDAWGFDVIPELNDIAFEEVRQYLRIGSLTNIPYEREQNFDTLVAIDVLEHIPETEIPQMVHEWERLGVQKLVLLINLNQFWYPGHITLRPLSWWAEQWKGSFRHVNTVGRLLDFPATYSNAGRYNQQWTVWERTFSVQPLSHPVGKEKGA
jgi:hypothetical protein